jgi:hypothetical protein
MAPKAFLRLFSLSPPTPLTPKGIPYFDNIGKLKQIIDMPAKRLFAL